MGTWVPNMKDESSSTHMKTEPEALLRPKLRLLHEARHACYDIFRVQISAGYIKQDVGDHD